MQVPRLPLGSHGSEVQSQVPLSEKPRWATSDPNRAHQCYLGRKNFQLSENESCLAARWWHRGHLGLTPKGQPKNSLEGMSHAPVGVGLPKQNPVELNGIEPMTSGLQSPRSPN